MENHLSHLGYPFVPENQPERLIDYVIRRVENFEINSPQEELEREILGNVLLNSVPNSLGSNSESYPNSFNPCYNDFQNCEKDYYYNPTYSTSSNPCYNDFQNLEEDY